MFSAEIISAGFQTHMQWPQMLLLKIGANTESAFLKSTMDLDGQISCPGHSAESNCSSHCTLMAKPILVQSATSNGNQPSKTFSTISESHNPRTKHTCSNSTSGILADCLASLGQSFKTKGLSEQASTLLLASWREKTSRSYQPGRYGVAGVVQREWIPLIPLLNVFVEFLAQQFTQGKSYRSLNVYQLAISSTFPQIDWVSVGQHPLVVRHMKGVTSLAQCSSNNTLLII